LKGETVGTVETLSKEVDFVVVGSGIGGLAGAIRAADGGLTVLVLERSSLLGGVSSVSFGELWVAGTHLERAAGIEDSVELAEEYLDFLGAGHQDKTLQARFLQASPEAPRVLRA
jgi:3-oxosteroid 1-dehydrogenase